jgi:hypothetical protein
MRYAALRKLEEAAPSTAVAVAEKLALDPSRTSDAKFLRENATALLVRAKTDDARAALARVKASSIDMAVLAARLDRVKDGH